MVVAFAEGAVTRLRREFKLLLSAEDAEALARRLTEEATPARTQITSVYFDRPGFPLMQRAHGSPEDCLKIRTKEYFPDVGSREARVVLEAKRERNGLTQKQRAWIRRAELRPLAQSGELWKRLPLLAPGGLSPVLAVTYVRTVYQHTEHWRVTVDRDVAFHRIDAKLAFNRTGLPADVLEPPVSREERVVVEVKHLGDELPGWLAALRGVANVRFSKFAEGMNRLTLAAADGAQGG